MTAPFAPAPPHLLALADARRASVPFLARVEAVRDGAVSPAGGDVSAHGSGRLVTRHLAHYLAALELARSADAIRGPGPDRPAPVVVDVGSGVGALGAWLAAELGARLHLVDLEQAPRAIAAQAFPEAFVHAEVSAVPAGTADLVLGMEVIEHVTPHEQAAFVGAVRDLLAPGGLLVMSTPDERRYLGGWSGYAPHVGPLTFDQLEALLERACGGLPTRVWRLEGTPFALGRVRAVAEPVANRAWAGLQRRSARTAAAAQAAGAALGRRLPSPGSRQVPAVWATDERDGPGTGLLGVVHRPRQAT